MKKVTFFCVNYNSYDFAERFLHSVDCAAMQVPDVDVEVCIGDNTTENWKELDIQNYPHVQVQFFPYHQNLGYLGCILRMMADRNWADATNSDFVVFSNVDLTIDSQYFVELQRAHLPEDVAWVAPDVYTPRLNRHDNPFMMTRPTQMSFIKWELMYACPFLFGLLEKIYDRKTSQRQNPSSIMPIYAGHGSIMMFTGAFLSRHINLQFPSFMYAEEIYMAELVRSDGLKAYYVPMLRVENVGEASTGLLGNRWRCSQKIKSLRIIKKIFDFGNE